MPKLGLGWVEYVKCLRENKFSSSSLQDSSSGLSRIVWIQSDVCLQQPHSGIKKLSFARLHQNLSNASCSFVVREGNFSQQHSVRLRLVERQYM